MMVGLPAVLLTAAGILAAGLLWKTFQCGDQKYDLLAGSEGDTDAETGGGHRSDEEPLHILPVFLGIITLAWQVGLALRPHCETVGLVAIIPGYMLGSYLALFVEWKHSTEAFTPVDPHKRWRFANWVAQNDHLVLIMVIFFPLFLWLMVVPLLPWSDSLPWYFLLPQAVSSCLGAFGVKHIARRTDGEQRFGLGLGLCGLIMAWFGGSSMFGLSWQLALFALPGCVVLFGLYVTYEADASLPGLAMGLLNKASSREIGSRNRTDLVSQMDRVAAADTWAQRERYHNEVECRFRAPPLFLGTITFAWLVMLPHCKKFTWQLVLTAVPGYLFGSYLALFARWYLWPKVNFHIPGCDMTDRMFRYRSLAFMMTIPVLHHFWLLALPLFHDVSIYVLGLQAIAATLDAWGVKLLTARSTEEKGFGLCLSGILIAWLAGLAMLNTFTWQLALFSLPGFLLLVMALIPEAREMIGFEWMDYCVFGGRFPPGNCALWMLRLLVWSFALPVLQVTGHWLLFLCVELTAYLAFAMPTAMYGFEPMSDDFVFKLKAEDIPYRTLMGFIREAAFMACLGAVAFWSSGNWFWTQWPEALRDLWPWDVFLVPSCLVSLWCVLEIIAHGVPGRARLMAMVNVSAVVLCLPFLLNIDIPEVQSGAPTLDLAPTDYVAVDLNFNNLSSFDLALKNSTVQWLNMPRPLWPQAAQRSDWNLSQLRNKYWLSYMFIKYALTTGMSVLVLSVIKLPSCEDAEQIVKDESIEHGNRMTEAELGFLTLVLVTAQLILCTKVTISAALSGQLTAAGLVWEGFDTCFTVGLCWLLVQALTMRIMNPSMKFDPVDISIATLPVLPFLGDPFDTVKDSILAAAALSSGFVWLQVLGAVAMMYLWAFHMLLLLPNKATRLELQQSYLSLLSVKVLQKEQALGHTTGVKLLAVAFKQSTPARQWAMIVEDLPQAVLACIISLAHHTRVFTVAVNILIPSIRILLAWRFHPEIAWQVKDWLLQEALDALIQDKIELSNEFAVALVRLQGHYPEQNFLRRVDVRLVGEGRKKVKLERKEGGLFPGEKTLRLSESIFRFWFLAHTVEEVEEGEAVEDRIVQFADSFSYSKILSLVLEDAAAMKGVAALWKPLMIFKVDAMYSTDVKALFADLCQMKMITRLHLSFKDVLGTESSTALAHGISELIQVTDLRLVLRQEVIEGEDDDEDLQRKLVETVPIVKTLAEGLAKLTQLTGLGLTMTGGHVGNEALTTLGESFSQMKQLSTLILRFIRCWIDNNGTRACVHGICKLGKITQLTLMLRLCVITPRISPETREALEEQLKARFASAESVSVRI